MTHVDEGFITVFSVDHVVDSHIYVVIVKVRLLKLFVALKINRDQVVIHLLLHILLAQLRPVVVILNKTILSVHLLGWLLMRRFHQSLLLVHVRRA